MRSFSSVLAAAARITVGAALVASLSIATSRAVNAADLPAAAAAPAPCVSGCEPRYGVYPLPDYYYPYDDLFRPYDYYRYMRPTYYNYYQTYGCFWTSEWCVHYW
jgi:hypothetical protein